MENKVCPSGNGHLDYGFENEEGKYFECKRCGRREYREPLDRLDPENPLDTKKPDPTQEVPESG